MTAQPDLSFFAPQARLFDLEKAAAVAATTQSDVVSVQVTQVNTGPSQLSITVSNQLQSGDVPNPPPTRPAFPPWRYNDLSYFRPGQRIRIDFRYGGKESGWQTMIVARITGMSFSFPSGGGAQMTLQGEDLLSLLKNADEKDQNYQKKLEEEIVKDLIDRSKSQLTPVAVQPPAVKQPLRSFIHHKKTSYLQVIQGMADAFDFEIWADDGSFDYGTLAGKVTDGANVKVHFEPARSLTAPGGSSLVLQWGGGDQANVVNVTDFNARLQVADQYEVVNAGGSDPGNKGKVTALANVGDIRKDLHPKDALDSAAVRSRFFSGAKGEKPASMTVDTTNLDKDRAQLKAAAELRKKARELLTVEGTAVGNLKLRAGIHVEVKGMNAPFDGIYYVTKSVHSLDGGGYKTQFSLRRPGLTDPSKYRGA